MAGAAISEAFVRIRPDFSGFKTAALGGASEQLKQLQTSVLDTEDAIKRAARENITSAVSQRESLTALHEEYALVARNAEKGSAAQVQANRLAADSARQLGVAYKETATSTGLFASRSKSAAKEASGLERGAIAGSGALSGMGRSLAFASTAFIGAAGFTSLVKGSISAASQLQDQLSRTTAVFGASSKAVLAWSKTSSSAFGIARSDALGAAGSFGTLLHNLGQTQPAAARMSMQMVELAGNMAAFKKVAPEQALQALQSALMGRTRQLKEFGISIDATSLKAEALSLGLLKSNVSLQAVGDAQTKVQIATERLNVAIEKHGKDSVQAAAATESLRSAQAALQKQTDGATGSLTTQQKSIAAYHLILEQAKGQSGAFAASQGELSVQEEKFHATLKDLEAEIGTKLLPVLTRYLSELTNWMNEAMHSAQLHRDLAAAATILHSAVTLVVGVVHTAFGAFQALSGVLGGVRNAVIALFAAFALSKMTGLAAAAVQLAMKFGLVGTSIAGVAGESKVAFAGMEVETISLGATMKSALVSTGIGAVLVAVGLLVAYVMTHWSQVKNLTEDLAAAMKGTFEAAWYAIKGAFDLFVYGLMAGFEGIAKAAASAFGWVPGIGGHIKKAMNDAVSYIEQFRKNGLEDMQKAGDTAGAAWSNAFDSSVQDGLNAALTQIKTFQTTAGAVAINTAGAASAGAVTAQAKGTTAGLVQAANAFGVGSGGTYATGGGHGGTVKPGSKLDCSGYVYQVYTANGFDGFPGTSEQQWNTMRGSNWVSEVIPWSDASPGDVVFMVGKGYPPPGHVGIVVSGSGMSADMMQYYESGAPPNTIKLSQIGDPVGVKRFYLLKQGGTATNPSASGGGTVGAPTGSTAAVTPISAVVPTSSLTSGAVAKTAKGLSEGAVASMKQTLATLGDKASGIAPDSLRAQVDAQIKLLTDAIHKGLGPETADKLRADIAQIRSTVNADLSMDKTVATLKTGTAAIGKEVSQLPPSMRAAISPQMAALRKELADVSSPADLAKAKADFKSLSEEIRKDLQIEKSVTGVRNSLSLMKAEVLALPPSLRSTLEPQMNELRNLLSNVTTAKGLAAAKNAYKSLAAEFRSDVAQMKTDASNAKSAFASAFNDIAAAAESVFDRKVQDHINAMTAALNTAVATIDAQLTATQTSLEAQKAALTPAEQALKDLQDQHAQAQRDAQLAADQAALAANTDATQTAQLQAAVHQDMYDAKVAALTAQATAERDAVNASVALQETAAQTAHDAQVKAAQDKEQLDQQNYQDQMDEQKKFFTNYLNSLQTQLEQRTITWGQANSDILGTLQTDFDLNPDWYTSGLSSGNNLLKGLADAFAAAAPTLNAYDQAVASLNKVQQAAPGSGATTTDLLNELKKVTSSTAATADHTKAIAAKPDAAAAKAPLTSGGFRAGENINQAARDALR